MGDAQGHTWGPKYALTESVNRLTHPVKTPKNAHNTRFFQLARSDRAGRKEMLHRATGVCFYPYFQLAQNPATVPTRPSRSRRPPVLDHLITCHFASVRNVNLNEALDDHLLAAHGERAFGEADGDDHGPAACAIAAYGITR